MLYQMFSCRLLTGLIFCLLGVAMTGCKQAEKTEKNKMFSRLPDSQSGIGFSNDITETGASHSFINEFGYMGGGVGIGDFNNDGLKDVFFTGNQVSSRAYINKGNNRFEDITEKAGISTAVWATGVSIADVNNDGYDDIYICVFGKDLIHSAKNLLFINQHDLSFKEQAVEYGLADTSFSTQAVFFDYDKDGDLDMYLANYLLADIYANSIFPRDRSGRSPANDRLYRNDGDSLHKGHPVFSDVSLAAGIKEDGYGLGVSVSDFNNDGWPDIYVANDFVSNDLLWLNNHDGSFTNCINRSLRHQSYSSMGSDAADLNNDGLSDIVTLDMLPETNERKKTSFFFMNYERYEAERAMGYEPEFARNMLQLNNGSYRSGDTSIPFFSEIGQLAGIDATDWSWSVLLADFNNDSWKDIHVTNGIGRDFINADFLEFSNNIFLNTQTREEQRKAVREKLASLEHVSLPNYLYLNQGGYSFADVSDKAGINELSMSNGAAYADLDNDGDLDLVVNNINKKAFLFLNNTIQQGHPGHTHYLAVRFKGDSLNTRGLGAKVSLYHNGRLQVQEQYPVRGYFSSVDQQLLFGLDSSARVDSLVVIWPDEKQQVIRNPAADTLLELSWQAAAVATPATPATPGLTDPVFSDITQASGIRYRHHDNTFNDFALQRLLPQKYSQMGPFITTGDINRDGETDLFAGGGFNFSGILFTQEKNTTFKSGNLIEGVKLEEDLDCILFDADNDGDDDLFVTSGDIRYEETAVQNKPRLYLNDGKGNFTFQQDAVPDHVRVIAGAVSAGDYDADNDLDLFIGGRVSRNYPLSPPGFLLQNNGGIFSDVTEKICPALKQPGMVTAAVWTDFDNDKRPDLVIAGEWMPMRFFANKQTGFGEVTGSAGLTEMNGMWRSLLATDIDNDGDTDLVAGNLGLNCNYRVSGTEPMEVFTSDIDGNGTMDPIFFYYIKDRAGNRQSFPGIGRGKFAEQVPSIKKQFLRSADYATAGFGEIFKGKTKEELMRLYCDETRSCYFENLGNGKFKKHPLPAEAQFAPVNAILCEDFDNDGVRDLLLAGNEYQTDVMTGRYDASYGCFLKGSKAKTFDAIPPLKSGFLINGDVKDMALIRSGNGDRIVVAAVNNDSLRVFRINTVAKN